MDCLAFGDAINGKRGRRSHMRSIRPQFANVLVDSPLVYLAAHLHTWVSCRSVPKCTSTCCNEPWPICKSSGIKALSLDCMPSFPHCRSRFSGLFRCLGEIPAIGIK
eukprot:scaffold118715_cov31-Tisochrysis_lutea.AAC.2